MNPRHTTKKSPSTARSARRSKLVVQRDTIGRLGSLDSNDEDGKKRSGAHDCPSTAMHQMMSGCETCYPPPPPHPPHPKK